MALYRRCLEWEQELEDWPEVLDVDRVPPGNTVTRHSEELSAQAGPADQKRQSCCSQAPTPYKEEFCSSGNSVPRGRGPEKNELCHRSHAEGTP